MRLRTGGFVHTTVSGETKKGPDWGPFSFWRRGCLSQSILFELIYIAFIQSRNLYTNDNTNRNQPTPTSSNSPPAAN